MSEQQKTAKDMLSEGYAQNFEKHKKVEKENQVVKVELNDEPAERTPLYWLVKYYSKQAEKQGK